MGHDFKIQIVFSCVWWRCSTPQDGESSLHSNRALVEYQAGKNVMTVAASVFRVATDLLQRAQGSAGQYTHC